MDNIEYHDICPTSRRGKFIPISLLCSPAVQLVEYSETQIFESLQAVSIRNCFLKGRDLVVFNNQFIPFFILWPQYRKSNLVNQIRQISSLCIRCSHKIRSIQDISCSLASHPCWEKNIFHWFIDILPRVLAAEFVVHPPAKPKLLKPGYLLDWQQESLEILGYNNDSIITLPGISSLSITANSFVTLLNGRSSQSRRLPFSTHPFIVKTLKQRFLSIKTNEFRLTDKRIFIKRDPLVGRCFLNIDEIEDFINAYNFQLVELSSLSLTAQIQLFQNATHVVGAHGAGLTHIIHCTNASIMEIHCSSHGIRSDYCQIAAINNLRYYYHVCTPANSNSDMVLDIQVLRCFMDRASD